MDLRITPAPRPRFTSRQGTIRGLHKSEICAKLGFKPEDPSKHPDSDGKVTAEWSFTVQGVPCFVWSFKGGGEYLEEWSAFGPELVLKAVFGDNYSKDD